MPVKIAWIALVALGVVSGADAAWAGKLTYWRFNTQQSRVDLITDAGTKPKAVVIHNPTRLIIDLPNTYIRKKKRQKRVSEYVKEVRVAQFSKWTTRMVVELDKDYSLRARSGQSSRDSPQSLVRSTAQVLGHSRSQS